MRKIKQQISSVASNFFEDEIFTRAAALAFYTALAIAPLVVLMIVAFAFLGLDLQAAFVKEVAANIGGDAASLLKGIIDAANDQPDAKSISGMIATGSLLISASFIFVQLQDTLNIIFDSEKTTVAEPSTRQKVLQFFGKRLLSMGILLGLIVVFTASLLVSTAIPFLASGQTNSWLNALNFLVSLTIFSLLFGLIFKWMPDRSIGFRNALLGGALTSILFMVGKTLIGLYLAKSAIGSPYGAAGSLMVTLVWVYYSSLVIFIGAEATFVSLVDKNSTGAEAIQMRDFKAKYA